MPEVERTKHGSIGHDLLALFDHVFARTDERLVGLTDDEYRWEPVPGCLTIDAVEPGAGRFEGNDAPSVATIGWRLCHVSDAIARHPLNEFLQTGFVPSAREIPRSATAGIDYFRRSCSEWRRLIDAVDEDAWFRPLGPTAGPFERSTVLAVTLHAADELVHHTAEIALLRDLYRRAPGS